ncbi:helix-turn-helix domain-containing protein [Spirosoma endbachense]|uniref:Helix-turn-helix domain-containing protein n=1 Tax=Spirosoma endbachense TaxID=2666025 RepID=A0A6P1VXC4_9BACT|nr:helix-turn-helix domain-containing protein [Spirosoma endbachense]QHV97284.1 helix-turn-helix domain-containing protein [Spirosoma endbachense]
MYGTVTQIQVTPDQLTELVRIAVRSELANYTPPQPEGVALPELMTRRQTADTLQVSLTTLHDWAKDTDDRSAILVPLKINGRVRYRRSDVLAALKEKRSFKVG